MKDNFEIKTHIHTHTHTNEPSLVLERGMNYDIRGQVQTPTNPDKAAALI